MSMERVQKKSSPRTQETEVEEVASSPAKRSSKADTDALLDEIDAVLEQSSVEFIRDYVQRGGQ